MLARVSTTISRFNDLIKPRANNRVARRGEKGTVLKEEEVEKEGIRRAQDSGERSGLLDGEYRPAISRREFMHRVYACVFTCRYSFPTSAAVFNLPPASTMLIISI